MKTKKHTTPMQIRQYVFLGGWSALYLINSLTFGMDTLDIWIFALIMIVTLGTMTFSIVFMF